MPNEAQEEASQSKLATRRPNRMNILTLKNAKVGDTVFEKLTLFTDENDQIILLPLLWSMHLNQTGTTYQWKITGKGYKGINRRSYGNILNPKMEFIESNLNVNTIKNYINHIFNFLKYINKNPTEKGRNLIHNTELLSGNYINNYINNALPEILGSASSVISHKSAIECYFNFLFFLEIRNCTEIVLRRNTKQRMAENCEKIRSISYICKKDRSELLLFCKTKRDRIIIRLGYEVGLRTSEVRGLILDDHKAKNSKHKGLISLFDELDSNPHQNTFKYLLNGKYTKRGKSRYIYFDRELLSTMKDYYNTERNEIVRLTNSKCVTLLLRIDNQGKGESIGKCQASNTFKELKSKVRNLCGSTSFHDLRHTFATELYHNELMDKFGHETRSESAALQTVSDRLGHKSTETTRIYIKIRMLMLSIEEMQK